MSELAVMDRSGDTKYHWDKNNPDEVALARKVFDEAVINKKMLAFRVLDETGKKGEQIRRFDPDAERILITPALVGG